jgi:ABC-type branched-subunit amino acid transport system ATPase component
LNGRTLAVSDLTRSFGGVTALAGCSFEVAPGRITALIGPNGSGKTTVFNCISGFYRPDGGAVLLGPVPITGWSPSRIVGEGLVRTFQVTRVFRALTVLENMAVPVRRWRLAAGARPAGGPGVRRRAEPLLALAGLEHLRDEPAGHLSFGQQRLLELVASLMTEPEIVLLDEPCGGLNPVVVDRLVGAIRALNAGGTTFLVVEHDMRFVTRLAHHVIVLHRGAVIATGSPAQVRADAAVLDAYLGT